MFKKAAVFAILAIAGTVISVGEARNAKMSVKSIITAQIQSVLPAKDHNDTCRVLTCAQEGEPCSDHSECPFMTGCLDGVCRHSLAGDTCVNSGCFNLTLYCNDAINVCTSYQKYGDKCNVKCKTGTRKYYCNATVDGVCKYKPQHEGDECDFESAKFCPDQTFCTASNSTPIGVCKGQPAKAGERCDESGECNEELSLYCSKDNFTCMEYPKAGDECYGLDHRCFAGLYCNRSNSSAGVCTPLKEPGEECAKSYECPEGYKCAENKMCMKENPGEGEYCDDEVECDDDDRFVCYNNFCIRREDHCEESDDCPHPYMYNCKEKKCVGRMSIKEGEECHIDFEHLLDDDYASVEILYALTSLQCEEGLVCVPKVRGLSKGTCQRPNTTVAANISCITDLGCPLDSICRCNDQTGDVQCIPFPPSSAELLQKYEKATDTIVACKKEYKGDLEIEEKVAKCSLKDVDDLVKFVGREVYPYSSEYRCLDLSLLGAASSVKASLLAVLAMALLAVLF